MNEAVKWINHRGRGFNFDGATEEPIEVSPSAKLNDATIDVTGGFEVGERVHFGHQVMVLTTSHPTEITNGEERQKAVKLGKVTIEDDVYIGSRATVLKGVTIGKGSYIGACSLVLEDTKIGSRELWAGVPAKLIRKL